MYRGTDVFKDRPVLDAVHYNESVIGLLGKADRVGQPLAVRAEGQPIAPLGFCRFLDFHLGRLAVQDLKDDIFLKPAVSLAMINRGIGACQIGLLTGRKGLSDRRHASDCWKSDRLVSAKPAIASAVIRTQAGCAQYRHKGPHLAASSHEPTLGLAEKLEYDPACKLTLIDE